MRPTVAQALDAQGRSRVRRKLYTRGILAPGGCLEWQGAITEGYGQMIVDGWQFGVHRVSYALEHGDVPSGLFVMHRCDNRPCFHPGHLSVGTPADNVRDMREKGRHPLGMHFSGAKLTDEQVVAIRGRYVRECHFRMGRWRSNAPDLAVEFDVSPSYVRQLVMLHWRKEAR